MNNSLNKEKEKEKKKKKNTPPHGRRGTPQQRGGKNSF